MRMTRALMGVALSFIMIGTAVAASPEATAARADIKKTLGFVPQFFTVLPDQALPGAWEEMKTVQMNPDTAIPAKYKELIGLAVAAQIPCTYCIEAHTSFAKTAGATDAELAEAVVMGALARHWSTVLNGIQTDESAWRAEVAKMVEHAKAQMDMPAPSRTAEVTDATTALKDIEQTMGFVPDFLKSFPSEGLAGAWKEFRDMEMSQTTAIPPKYKDLISLGVSAQVPCRYCTIADTQFAKLAGATEREIGEAIAMSAIVRHWSTVLNGLQVDQAQFAKDLTRLEKEARKKTAEQEKYE